ncbi:MAG: hypothetical protein RL571_3486, partial [Pseudomonadota bacterium]
HNPALSITHGFHVELLKDCEKILLKNELVLWGDYPTNYPLKAAFSAACKQQALLRDDLVKHHAVPSLFKTLGFVKVTFKH